jgi:hypothetical protein
MPRVVQIPPSAGSSAGVRDTLVGFQEIGGAARPAGTARTQSAETTPDSASDGTAGQSRLTGVVFDSTTGRPLRDVQISIAGGPIKAVTSDGGRYELPIDGPVSGKLIFEHPRLRLFHVADRVQNISLPEGSRAQASVIIPSYTTLRRQLCGQNETGTEPQGMGVGYVLDAAGNPVFHAHVWATWRILWIEQNGKLVSTNQQRVVETDTGPDGSYMLCGFTRGAQISAKVSMAGKGTTEEKLAFPVSMVMEHDFRLSGR